jgi:hypothetical protein
MSLKKKQIGKIVLKTKTYKKVKKKKIGGKSMLLFSVVTVMMTITSYPICNAGEGQWRSGNLLSSERKKKNQFRLSQIDRLIGLGPKH